MEEQSESRIYDFRNFVFAVWRHLNFEPTPVIYDVAQYMQDSGPRTIVEGFRGLSKSTIASAYAVWRLHLDPALNILVVSASKQRADNFSIFTMKLIREIPFLRFLIPSPEQRSSNIGFDVGPAPAAHQPSVMSLGIGSQLAGARADIIIPDDVEVPNNTLTQGQRDKLDEQIRDFENIIKPDNPDAKIIYLGTPHTEDTIYTKLQSRGYTARYWPIEFMSEQDNINDYAGNIAPICIDEERLGESTEPLRFSASYIADQQTRQGAAGYKRQFLLNPTLGDMERYPLKVNDLIITEVDQDVAPEKVVYASSPENEWGNALPNVGLSRDRFYRPMKTAGDMIPYTGSVLAVDPAGRGKDETGICALKMLNGQLFCPELQGLQGGYDDKVLLEIANMAKRNKVNKIIAESNMGDGMFTELLKPVLNKVYPCAIEEVRHHTQKEKRIADTMEPVLGSHKLILDPNVIRQDYESIQRYPAERRVYYSLIYQLSRLTRDKGCLMQDDRLDVLAIAIAYWVEQMGQDVDRRIQKRRNDLLDKDLRDFEKSVFGRKPKQLTWM